MLERSNLFLGVGS